jgi:hypothetical protein
MTNLIEIINRQLPDVVLVEGSAFYWSPKNRTITYKSDELTSESGRWALLHEAAHASLGHTTYGTDVELLLLEVAAWQEAQRLSQTIGITIDEEHIQDCLDTYRDWLHQRSTCPVCGIVSLQDSPRSYRCHNCHTSWLVSASRFCRPYRLSKWTDKVTMAGTRSKATFQ